MKKLLALLCALVLLAMSATALAEVPDEVKEHCFQYVLGSKFWVQLYSSAGGGFVTALDWYIMHVLSGSYWYPPIENFEHYVLRYYDGKPGTTLQLPPLIESIRINNEFETSWYSESWADLQVLNIGNAREIRSLPMFCDFNGIISGDSPYLLVGPNALSSMNGINPRGVTIPLRYVGACAFEDCTNLVDITLDSYCRLDDGAFWGCSNLTSVSIHGNHGGISIGPSAFSDSGLKHLEIPDGIELELEHRALLGLTSVKANNVFCIGKQNNCDLEEVYLNLIDSEYYEKNGRFSEEAFASNFDLKKVSVTGAVDYIPDSAFFWDTAMTDVTLPEDYTKVGKQAFWACNSLEDIPISDKLETVDYGAFGGTAVKAMELPDTLTSMGANVYWNCSNLQEVCFHSEKAEIDPDVFGSDESAVKGITVYAPAKSRTYSCLVAIQEAHPEQIKEIVELELDKPVIKKLTPTSKQVKITWNKVKNAQSYEVYRKTKTGDFKLIGTTKKNSYTDKTVKANTEYSYRLVAKNKYVTSKPGKAKSTVTFAAPSGVKAAGKKAAIALSWKKIKNAASYDIWYTTDKNEKPTADTKALKTSKKPKLTLKKLESGKTYYVYIRPYAKCKDKTKVYGPWSKVKKVKVK